MDIESGRGSLAQTEVGPKSLWERRIGPSQIERKETVLSGEEGKQIPVLYTVVQASSEANFGVVYDKDLVEGMVAGAGGLLIDQEATQKLLKRRAGRLPEDFIEKFPERTVVVCPSNFGWQKGAFLVDNGQLILIENDRGEINGKFRVMGSSQDAWGSVEVELKDGKVVSSGGFQGIERGFSMPLILRDGKVVPLEEIISDPRLMADLRNVFDFGSAEGLPGEFWGLLRDFLPTMEVTGKRLAKGRSTGAARRGLDEEKVAEFKAIIEANEKLRRLIEIKNPKPELTIMVIKDKLPLNRIPAVGIGFTRENQLLVVAADGRQEGSAGVTIEELAKLMKQEGAVTAGLGSAGGDVAVVAKTKDGTEILNSPSSQDHKTRPVPCVLVVSP